MPRYQKGTAGKLIIQDYSVVETYPDVPRLYILTERQAGMLLAITEFLHWQTRWQNYEDWDTVEQLVSETEFNLMNPITCAMLKECLEPMFQQVKQDILGQLAGGSLSSEYPVGEPLPEEVLDRDLAEGSNLECDWDILWAQCVIVVDYLVRLTTDILEQIEANTNVVEAADVVIDNIPAVDEMPVAGATAQYINLLIEGVGESYVAAMTDEYKRGLACDFFCAARVNCEVTINMIWSVMQERMSGLFGTPEGSLATIVDLLTYLANQNLESATIGDALNGLSAGTGALANFWLNHIGFGNLETVIIAAKDEPSGDWELYCTDCPEPEAAMPIISLEWEGFPYELDGTDIVDDGDGYWIVQNVFIDPVSVITIQDIDGRIFELSDFSYPDGTNASTHWYEQPDGTDVNNSATTGVTTPVVNYGWIWTEAAGVQHVRFHMALV